MSYDQSVKHNLLLKSFFLRAECAAALFCFFRMQPPTAEVHARTKDESKTWRLRLAAGGWVDANRGGIKGAVSLTGTGLFPLCPNPPILHLHRNKKHAAKHTHTHYPAAMPAGHNKTHMQNGWLRVHKCFKQCRTRILQRFDTTFNVVIKSTLKGTLDVYIRNIKGWHGGAVVSTIKSQ